MGAFVGNVTSPFHRRRKGRIGKQILIEKTAAPLTGTKRALHAAGNTIGTIIINRGQVVNEWAISLDKCQTWNLRSSADNFLRFDKFNSRPVVFGLLGIIPEYISAFLLGARRTDGLGASALATINEFGENIRQEKANAPNLPQESAAWTPDGQYFCSVGNATGAPSLARCYVGSEPASATIFTVDVGTDSGLTAVLGINDSNVNAQASFLCANNEGTKLFKIRLRFGQWESMEIADPDAAGSRLVTSFCQYQNIIIGVKNAGRVIRSIDYGKTWQVIIAGWTGTAFICWRNFGYFYLGTNTGTQLWRSKFGLTWEANPINQPESTQDITAACNLDNASYIFSDDGLAPPNATPRCYQMRNAMEI